MGIDNLLQVIRSSTRKTHLKEFSGKTAAIDTYGWLHRGTYACSTELCLQGDSDKYITYCMRRVDLLIQNGVKPVLVFDGGFLPIKGNKENEREEKRKKYLAEGMIFYRSGDTAKAQQSFSKAVDVTPEMAYKLICALKKRKIEYIVAPYEADAQMAYLVRNGICDFVISEDSDCIPFGCRTVFFKLDKTGSGEVVDVHSLKSNQEISLSRFNDDMILDMCILAGCDYLPSLSGMGIKKAHGFVHRYKTTHKILRGVRFDGSFRFPKNYEIRFHKARLAFRHQRVFSGVASDSTLRLVCLNPLPSDVDPKSVDFIGPLLDPEIAKGIATGTIHPINHKKMSKPETTLEPLCIKKTEASLEHVNLFSKRKRAPSPPMLQHQSSTLTLKEDKYTEFKSNNEANMTFTEFSLKENTEINSKQSNTEKALTKAKGRGSQSRWKRFKPPTNRMKDNICSIFFPKRSTKADEPFKIPRKTTSTQSDDKRNSFVPETTELKYKENEDVNNSQMAGPGTCETGADDDDGIRGEYHSNLVSSDFRPLPLPVVKTSAVDESDRVQQPFETFSKFAYC